MMKSLVISTSPIIKIGTEFYAYSPYVDELNLWAKYSKSISFTCPIWKEDRGLLISKINFKIDNVYELNEFNFKKFKGIFYFFIFFISNFYKIINSISKTQHIHLRCPGNIGLVACFAQLFFPKKIKTVKYAGNWDLKSKQPLSYKIQKFILNSTFLTRNCKVLVYGKWEKSSSNIVPFFTATYTEAEKQTIEPRKFSSILKFIFVGTLSSGKRPQYAIELVENLNKLKIKATLEMYGDGTEKENLNEYIVNNNLENFIFIKGNQSRDTIKKAYQESHFIILPSKSEGWPKAIAEAMFWGCLPIATKVSCVPYMLDYNARGILLDLNLKNDIDKIVILLKNVNLYVEKAHNAINWSRKYTKDFLESEIKKLLQ